ncbi:Uncharacterised protein [Segatella copri]|nr:Uncharacterised protein [Segatella copri]
MRGVSSLSILAMSSLPMIAVARLARTELEKAFSISFCSLASVV